MPARAMTSGKMFGYVSFGNAMGRPNEPSYVVMHA